MQPAGSREPGSCQRFLLRFVYGAYLELDLGLSNVSLTAVSAGNLLCLPDLVPDSLSPCQLLFPISVHPLVPRR